MKEFFTTQDVAIILGITRVTVRNWVLKGLLRASVTKGGHRRIRRKDLELFLASRDVPVSLIREYELARQKRFLYCWEYHNLGFLEETPDNRKNCHNCLVYKCRAQKCHLIRRHLSGRPEGYASGEVRADNDYCSSCEYFNKYMNSETYEG